MAAVDVSALFPIERESKATRDVVLVARDDRTSALLGNYLESRGWSVTQVADPRRVVRRWGAAGAEAPLVVLHIDHDDPDAFELLGALAARALTAHVLVCAVGPIEGLASLGIDRVLAQPCRFSEVAAALEEVVRGFAVRGEP